MSLLNQVQVLITSQFQFLVKVAITQNNSPKSCESLPEAPNKANI